MYDHVCTLIHMYDHVYTLIHMYDHVYTHMYDHVYTWSMAGTYMKYNLPHSTGRLKSRYW